jgi:soluble lytic murein transglycosylase-like protein
LKSKTIAILLVAITAWAIPIHAASATPSKEEQAIFINYEKHHKVSQPTEKPVSAKPNKPRFSAKITVPAPAGPSVRYEGKAYSKAEVEALIRQYSQQYGVSPTIPLAIAKCESGFRWDAKNKSSSASGVYQWLSSSWRGQPNGKLGHSVFDADKNIQAAVWLIAHGKTSPWNASIHCWNH